MYSVYSDWSSTSRVSPFGNPRIKTCLQFPVAYRSLSRPSSPVHAKASSIRHKLLKSCHFTWFGLVPFSTLLCLDTLFTTGVFLIWHRNAFKEKHLTTDTLLAQHRSATTEKYPAFCFAYSLASTRKYSLIYCATEQSLRQRTGAGRQRADFGKSTYVQNLMWSYTGSNRGPPACKAGALPTEL